MFFDNIIDFDRPILIKGKKLKLKVTEKIVEVQAEIDAQQIILDKDYAQCLEGSFKANQKRELLRKLQEIQTYKVYLERLEGQIQNRKNYALSISEAASLKIIE